MIELKNEYGVAVIDPYGAQVMSYIPAGGEEMLWRTSDDFIAGAKAKNGAVRGGIPLCWPWFGPHPDGKSPQHGFARTSVWQVKLVDGNRAVLAFASDGSHEGFPYKADVELEVHLDADGLSIYLTTVNTDSTPFMLSQALHTYLRVSDVERVKLIGLHGATTDRGRAGEQVTTISGEVDDIYEPVTDRLLLDDPMAEKRGIIINSMGCLETVIWNPGADKADVPAGGYKHFLCVEAANAKQRPLVKPGGSHTLTTQIKRVD